MIWSFLRSRQFFTLWFGWGIPPFLIGTVVVAFLQSVAFGIVALVVTSAWAWDTFSTTCRRCPFYNSTKCGIPSAIVPFFFKKKSAYSISLRRVHLHYYADAAMIVFVNFVYAHVPAIFPVVVLCSLIGWLIVFRPKKFHGLLFRLGN